MVNVQHRTGHGHQLGIRHHDLTTELADPDELLVKLRRSDNVFPALTRPPLLIHNQPKFGLFGIRRKHTPGRRGENGAVLKHPRRHADILIGLDPSQDKTRPLLKSDQHQRFPDLVARLPKQGNKMLSHMLRRQMRQPSNLVTT
jgi:hypothetical protein